jgi:hypothetical protein
MRQPGGYPRFSNALQDSMMQFVRKRWTFRHRLVTQTLGQRIARSRLIAVRFI